MNHTYEIETANDNPYDIVIKKGNITAEFTLRQLEDQQREVSRMITAAKAQINLEQSKLANIVEHHPFISHMSEQDLFTAHMYQTSMAIIKGLETRLPELEQALEESLAEEKYIADTLGLDIKPNEQMVDKAVRAITE